MTMHSHRFKEQPMTRLAMILPLLISAFALADQPASQPVAKASEKREPRRHATCS
jgi:hypothetical protein